MFNCSILYRGPIDEKPEPSEKLTSKCVTFGRIRHQFPTNIGFVQVLSSSWSVDRWANSHYALHQLSEPFAVSSTIEFGLVKSSIRFSCMSIQYHRLQSATNGQIQWINVFINKIDWIWIWKCEVCECQKLSYRCHYRWCGMNRNVSVRKIVPILLMNICVQVADSVNCFSPKRLCDRLVERPFVVHQSQAVCVQRYKPIWIGMCDGFCYCWLAGFFSNISVRFERVPCVAFLRYINETERKWWNAAPKSQHTMKWKRKREREQKKFE